MKGANSNGCGHTGPYCPPLASMSALVISPPVMYGFTASMRNARPTPQSFYNPKRSGVKCLGEMVIARPVQNGF
jgi:hypothetical protein